MFPDVVCPPQLLLGRVAAAGPAGSGEAVQAVSLFVGQDEGRAGTAGSGKGAVAARATEDVPPTSAAVSQLILARDAPWALLQQENLPPPPAVPAAQRGYYSPVTQT